MKDFKHVQNAFRLVSWTVILPAAWRMDGEWGEDKKNRGELLGG